MKKITYLLLALILCISLATTAFADTQILQMSKPVIPEEGLIYITVELTQSVVGDSVGISYTYDSEHLKPVEDSCSWVPQGFMQDFDKAKHKGAWASEDSVDLKGGLCVLAFELQPEAKFKQTEVACTVIVKNGANTVGTYAAKTVLKTDCKHTFAEPEHIGDIGHKMTCTKCQGQQIASHQWDNGETTKNADGSTVKILTCKTCNGQKLIPITGSPDSPATSGGNDTPSGPSTLKPPKPTTDPDVQGPTEATKDPETGDHDAPDHDHDSQQPGKPDSTAPSEHAGHDHTQTNQTPEDRTATVIAVCVAAVALLSVVVWFVFKKK